MRFPLFALLTLLLSIPSPAQIAPAPMPYADWPRSASLFILTTPDGADLPADAMVEGFPLLVRLNKESLDFTAAQAHGEDVRFATNEGLALPYQIEAWDAARGEAAVWVRVPKIVGHERQELRMFFGKTDARSESSGAAVFGESNGFLSVWHLGAVVADEVGTLESKDIGTTSVVGVVGAGRHFAGGQGIFGGDRIANYPAGAGAHSTAVWFRAERANATILGWGNEGGGRGSKVRMQFRSPPHVHIDSDFSNVESASRLPLGEWIHVVHTYGDGPRKIYINGQLDGSATTKLDIKSPARLWLGGWYHNYDFVGDLDEVRISNVARSAAWVRLEYENQKPMQTLVGLVAQKGDTFAVAPPQLVISEGKSATVTAQAGGAQKVSWVLRRDEHESVVAVDRFSYTLDAGRVVGDATATLQFRAVYADGVKTKDIPVKIVEEIPDPAFVLQAPAVWNGRDSIEVVPLISNMAALRAKGAGDLQTTWKVTGGAVIQKIAPDKLLLQRAQFSGPLTVQASISNGGDATVATAKIFVTEPENDPWVERVPAKDEKPMDHQFIARDDTGEGTLFYRGTLEEPVESVFLRVFAEDRIFKSESQKLTVERDYAFAVRLKPGLVHYKVEFGTKAGAVETVLQTASDIVCGDAYLILGQSNALATDTRESSPPVTNEWIRSYGRPSTTAGESSGNLWCNPVWKARNGEKAELGWWGMELAQHLVESQKIPICIINGAVGGTRIDQHQRNEANPADLATIYGRMLWRAQQARLTHGIRGILWHQGENNQGTAGPSGDYDWKDYEQYFIALSGAWKRDFPNVQHYYVFQIWPNSCAMAGKTGAGDMIRETQRSLPRLYSHMSVMSTLGIKPAGGCHFPLTGWAEFARLIQPLIERDNYGRKVAESITPPNLQRVSFVGAARDSLALEFDQPIVWDDVLAGQFYLDGERDKVASGELRGNILTLKLKEPSAAAKITYLKESEWSQDKLIFGTNGIAALTFCDVPIAK
jgi:hypothetical protein